MEILQSPIHYPPDVNEIMACNKCHKELKKVNTYIPDIAGKVCSNCRRNWRLKNEPGFKESSKLRQDAYNHTHKEQHRSYKILRQEQYPELSKRRNARFRAKHPDRNKSVKYKIWRRKYDSNRYHTDIKYKLSLNLRTRLNRAIKFDFKTGSAVKDLGCTISEFKAYIESKFQPGMTWENWGITGWHIDHIVPLASFDLSDRVQLLQACHYTNLQPLWWYENVSKSNKSITIIM